RNISYPVFHYLFSFAAACLRSCLRIVRVFIGSGKKRTVGHLSISFTISAWTDCNQSLPVAASTQILCLYKEQNRVRVLRCQHLLSGRGDSLSGRPRQTFQSAV